MMRRILEKLLKEYSTLEGYEVKEADSGVKALELLNSEKFDLMILDIMMPIMDGLLFLIVFLKKKEYLL